MDQKNPTQSNNRFQLFYFGSLLTVHVRLRAHTYYVYIQKHTRKKNKNENSHVKSHDWMQRLSAARSYVFSFGNWGVGSALLSYAKTSSVSHARRGVRRVGHHRRDVRVLPTHPTLETKKITTNKVERPHVKTTQRHMRSHSQHRLVCCEVWLTFSQRVVSKHSLRNSYAYNPSPELYHEHWCSNARRVDA